MSPDPADATVHDEIDDLLGRLADHPLVATTRTLAAELLAPAAEEVDRTGVPLTHVKALATAGVVGAQAPAEHGGGGLTGDAARSVTEVLSGADGATWFVLTQHHLPVAMLAASNNPAVRRRWLEPLSRGEALAGVAVSHLRRPGPPAVTARPDGDGWVVDGFVGWMTSWGLCDTVLLGAEVAGEAPGLERLVFALVDAHDQPGLSSTGPMALAAMQATSTTQLRLDGLRLPAETVVDVVAKETFLAVDRAKTANVTPAVPGLLRAVLHRLADVGAGRGEPVAVDLARHLAERGGAVRQAAYRLIDEVPAGERVDERLALRVELLELTDRAASALVVAGSGMSMSLSNPAQRWAREALFHLVQAQTAPVRRATLERFLGRG